MCGIFGIWNFDGQPIDLAAVQRATSSLRHRGPDDEGYLLVNTADGTATACGGPETDRRLGLPTIGTFAGHAFNLAFGFRRLSILDLSPMGHQPMASADGRYWIVFNGEIYNYVELRAELTQLGYEFKTGTDTEVILAAYQHWGDACVRQFNGMWAFALWDGLRRQLFLARDRFGIKPLYTVSSHASRFAFASEVKALFASGVVRFRPSQHAIAGYVALKAYPSHRNGESFFEGVQSLAPSHHATISAGKVVPKQYWDFPTEESAAANNVEEVLESYRHLFFDAVKIRLRSDVSVGTCLSGGLDSSSIVGVLATLLREDHQCSLASLGKRQKTFSAVYESEGSWNERHHIDRVLQHVNAESHFVTPTFERLLAEAEDLVWYLEEPCWSASMFAQWCVLKLARDTGVTVVVNGQGADELLAGYQPSVFPVYLRDRLNGGRIFEAVRAARQIGEVSGLKRWSLLNHVIMGQLKTNVLRLANSVGGGCYLGRYSRNQVRLSGLSAELRDEMLSDAGRFSQRLAPPRTLNEYQKRAFLEKPLQPILRYEDRLSMAHSVESRLPFLDYRLVEFVFRQSPTFRIRNGWTKWIHRVALEDVMPADIAWRRDKVGFGTPLRPWLNQGRRQLTELLQSCDGIDQFLDVPYIRSQLKQPFENDGQAKLAWRWFNLARWLKTCSERTIIKPAQHATAQAVKVGGDGSAHGQDTHPG